jgi:hypothetical protein
MVVAYRAPLEAAWEPPPPDVVVVAGHRRPDLEVAEEMEGIRRSSHPKPGRDRNSSHPPPSDVVVVAGQRRPDLEVAEEMEGVGRSSHPKPGRDRSSSHPPSGWAAAARIHRRRHRSSKWCDAGAARRSSRGCSPGCSSSSSAVFTDSSPRI